MMKKYIVTSYIPNADIDVKFYNSLVVMSRDVGAEIIVADCKANYVNDPSSLLQYAIDDELKDVVVKGSFKFNNKLSLTDYRQSINVIDPIFCFASLFLMNFIIISHPNCLSVQWGATYSYNITTNTYMRTGNAFPC